jgi:hypothetical protein
MTARISPLLLFATAVAFGVATSARAGEVNLRWNECWGDGGVQNRVFACDRNTGSEVLVASFVPFFDFPQMTGDEFVVDFATASTPLAQWWWFLDAGNCRQSSMALVSDPPASAVACSDWDEAQAGGLFAGFTFNIFLPSAGRITGMHWMRDGLSAPVLAGHEYHAFTLVINHQKTVGDGACGGCTLGACIAFRSFRMTSPDPQFDQRLSLGNQPGSAHDAMVTWQGGTGVVSPAPGGLSCPAATPAKNSTWGAVKSLYR